MTGLPRWFAFAAVAAAVTVLAPAAQAKNGSDDPEFHRGPRWDDPHVRYPYDAGYDFGTIRVEGPTKGPYVERCWWTAKTVIFGFPIGFTQHCVRYTNENTN